MSSFTFSHQFSQHWLNTLPSIKQAIIQELDDIATLLQPHTELATYQFHISDLDSHVNSIITEENVRLERLHAEQQEQQRQEAERLAAEQLALAQAEQTRLEQIRREEMRLENERLEQIRLEKEYLAQQRLSREKKSQETQDEYANDLPMTQPPEQIPTAIALATISEKTATPVAIPVNSQKTTAHFANMANTAPTLFVYEKIKQDITANLNQQMEEYIQESIQLMRDDLRPWLDSEVEKQLKEWLIKNPTNV